MDLVLGSLCLIVPAAAFVAIVVSAVVLTSRARQRRLQGMAAYAATREWRFTEDGTGLESRYPGEPFGRGSGRRASNVVDGSYEGRPFLAFDYRYTTGSGDDRSTSRYSVVAVHLGPLLHPVPRLQVSPQGALGRFFGNLFGTDHHLGDPGFDDAFHVRTDSPELARDVLHPDMRLTLSAYQDRAWRLEGDSMLMFKRGEHSPAEIDAVLASMHAILSRVPPLVWDRLRGGETPR